MTKCLDLAVAFSSTTEITGLTCLCSCLSTCSGNFFILYPNVVVGCGSVDNNSLAALCTSVSNKSVNFTGQFSKNFHSRKVKNVNLVSCINSIIVIGRNILVLCALNNNDSVIVTVVAITREDNLYSCAVALSGKSFNVCQVVACSGNNFLCKSSLSTNITRSAGCKTIYKTRCCGAGKFNVAVMTGCRNVITLVKVFNCFVAVGTLVYGITNLGTSRSNNVNNDCACFFSFPRVAKRINNVLKLSMVTICTICDCVTGSYASCLLHSCKNLKSSVVLSIKLGYNVNATGNVMSALVNNFVVNTFYSNRCYVCVVTPCICTEICLIVICVTCCFAKLYSNSFVACCSKNNSHYVTAAILTVVRILSINLTCCTNIVDVKLVLYYILPRKVLGMTKCRDDLGLADILLTKVTVACLESSCCTSSRNNNLGGGVNVFKLLSLSPNMLTNRALLASLNSLNGTATLNSTELNESCILTKSLFNNFLSGENFATLITVYTSGKTGSGTCGSNSLVNNLSVSKSVNNFLSNGYVSTNRALCTSGKTSFGTSRSNFRDLNCFVMSASNRECLCCSTLRALIGCASGNGVTLSVNRRLYVDGYEYPLVTFTCSLNLYGVGIATVSALPSNNAFNKTVTGGANDLVVVSKCLDNDIIVTVVFLTVDKVSSTYSTLLICVCAVLGTSRSTAFNSLTPSMLGGFSLYVCINEDNVTILTLVRSVTILGTCGSIHFHYFIVSSVFQSVSSVFAGACYCVFCIRNGNKRTSHHCKCKHKRKHFNKCSFHFFLH